MGTKQHKAFCGVCDRTTNHITHYSTDDRTQKLEATVLCSEHTS